MAPNVPTEVPTVITAGETVQFTRAFQDFPPSDGWLYSFHLNGPTDVVHKNAEDGSDPFLLILTPTDTDIGAGLYHFEERVTLPGSDGAPDQTFSIADGAMTVQINLATAPPGATESHAQKMVRLIEQEIENRMTQGGGVQSYSIGSGAGTTRMFVKVPIEKLQQMLGMYRSQVNMEGNPSTLFGTPAKISFPETAPTSDYPPTWIDVVGLPDNR
jgi:hypothetical protein